MRTALDTLQEQFLLAFNPMNADEDNRLILEWYLAEYDRLLKTYERANKLAS